MSYPRKKLDLNLLILERRSCEAMEYAAKQKNPNWSFEHFEALHFGILEGEEPGEEYDVYRVLSQAEPYLDELDRQIPFLHPLERGNHYVWELFVDIPRVGSSRSTRQLWNRLARAMSDIRLPIETEEFIDQYGELLQGLLKGATDMGDRFYLSELDYGGWDGGIISKDFLIEGLQMLVDKLRSPVCERTKKEKKDNGEKPAEQMQTADAAERKMPAGITENEAVADAVEKEVPGDAGKAGESADGAGMKEPEQITDALRMTAAAKEDDEEKVIFNFFQ